MFIENSVIRMNIFGKKHPTSLSIFKAQRLAGLQPVRRLETDENWPSDTNFKTKKTFFG